MGNAMGGWIVENITWLTWHKWSKISMEFPNPCFKAVQDYDICGNKIGLLDAQKDFLDAKFEESEHNVSERLVEEWDRAWEHHFWSEQEPHLDHLPPFVALPDLSRSDFPGWDVDTMNYFRSVFYSLDENKGVLTQDQVHCYLKSLGVGLSWRRFKIAFKKIDRDKIRALNFDQFVKVIYYTDKRTSDGTPGELGRLLIQFGQYKAKVDSLSTGEALLAGLY